MNGLAYKFATGAVLFDRMTSASKYLFLAARCATIALWMVHIFEHWILMIIAAMIGIQAIAFFVQACEIYVQARPPESWQDRERRLRSRAMYVPRERERKNKGTHRD